MNWPAPFAKQNWVTKENVLIWYDRPVCFIAHDDSGIPHLCAFADEEGDVTTFTALPISEQQGEGLRHDRITHASCWIQATGPLWAIHENHAAGTVTISQHQKGEVPQWWPTDTEDDLEPQETRS